MFSALRSPLSALLICILSIVWGSTASAQPTFGNVVCSSTRENPPPPAPAVYKIKGATSITNVPAGATQITVVFTFQKKVAGNWVDAFDTSVTTNPAGAGNITTDYIGFSPAAAEEWRVKADGFIAVQGPPPRTDTVPTANSPAITPKP